MAGNIPRPDIPAHPRRWALLTVLSMGLFIIGLDNSILYTALPTLAKTIGAEPMTQLFIIAVYPLVVAGLLPGTGTLGDKVGHTRLFIIGLIIFGLASLGSGLAGGPLILIAFRALLAVGAALMMPSTLALIRIFFADEAERNTAIGIWGAIAIGGSAAGPVLGGVLLSHFHWGSVFLINVPVVIASLIALIALKPPNIAHPRAKWDVISSIWALLSLSGTVLALESATHGHWIIAGCAFVVGMVGVICYRRRARSLKSPFIDFKLFNDHRFSAGVIAAVLSAAATAGVQLVITQRLQILDGFSPLKAGLVTLAIAVASLPAALLSGDLATKYGARRLTALGLLLAGIGTAMAVFFHATGFGMIWFIVGLGISGIGLGLGMSGASILIINSAPERSTGMASSIEEVSFEIGSLAGVIVCGSVLNLVYGSKAPEGTDSDIAHAIEQGGAAARQAMEAWDNGYVVVLWLAAAILIAGAWLTLKTAFSPWVEYTLAQRRARKDKKRKQQSAAAAKAALEAQEKKTGNSARKD